MVWDNLCFINRQAVYKKSVNCFKLLQENVNKHIYRYYKQWTLIILLKANQFIAKDKQSNLFTDTDCLQL